jgi:peptidylprolyl isomerase
VSRFLRAILGLTLLATAACSGQAAAPPPGPAAAPPAPPAPVAARAAAVTPHPVAPANLPAPADVAAAPADARKTKSGLASKVLTPGIGKDHPGTHDRVKVNYTGWTADGRMFDSSVARGVPSQFVLDRMIKGWAEGLALMVRGEKRRLWIPAALAYGDSPTRPGLPAGPLTFDITLIDFAQAGAPSPTVAR